VASDPVQWTDILESVTTAGAMAIAIGVAIVEARRANRANNERDALLEEQKLERYRGTAKLVSAWIERGFLPVPDGTTFIPYARAHIINESNDPVFDVQATVYLQPDLPDAGHPIALGPLSIPRAIPVLPPRRELEFDLTLPLLPYSKEESGARPDLPVIELLFTDPDDVKWAREIDGRLVAREKRMAELIPSDDQERADRQIGRLDSSNPLAVVFTFLHLIRDENLTESDVMAAIWGILSLYATGWQGVTYQDLMGFRDELAEFSVATNVLYPVPQVAYVKLVLTGQPDQLMYSTGGEGLVYQAKFVTLTFSGELGWRIFSYGGLGTEPDRIYFPPETLD
jgi:hypothetical protein